MAETADISVVGLNIFPVKSCKAVRVQEIQVDSYGVVGDRRFMIVDQGGRFVTQRKQPKLAKVKAMYVPTGETDSPHGAQQLLQLSSPDMETVLQVVPKDSGRVMHCSVWESEVDVVDQGDEAADWLSKLLESPTWSYRLVATGRSVPDGAYKRLVELPPSLRNKLPPMEVALADSAPTSLVSHESLTALNEKMSEHTGNTVTLDRFRMNIEVAGCSKPYEEDEWLLIKIGSAPFLVYRDAERCKMTGVDQDTGQVDKVGPLEILRIYRAPEGPTHAKFGQLLIPLQKGTRVRVGDKVEVIERKRVPS